MAVTRGGTNGRRTNPRRQDVLDRVAGYAHEDAEPDDRAAARRHGKSRRTAARWRSDGPPDLREHQTYIMNSPRPFRLLSHMKAVAKARIIDLHEKEGVPGLVRRYHEILAMEKETEAADTRLDLSRTALWLEKMRQSERDAALDEEKAAIEFLFAEKRVTWDEVWGDPRPEGGR